MTYTLHVYANPSLFTDRPILDRQYRLKTDDSTTRTDPADAKIGTKANDHGRSSVAAALPYGMPLPATRAYAARILREWRKLPRRRFGTRRTKNSTSIPLLVA